MKLDSRIIEGKKPLDCFDVDIAKQFIGKKGYVTDFLHDFCNLNKVKVSELKTVLHTELFCYLCGSVGKKYFLPVEWVKEPEKKYRPFTLDEWIGQHTMGDVIRYRCKSQKIELRHMYVGYAYGIGADIKNTTSGTLTLGVASYPLDYLFEDYEIKDDGEWHPFGVIDEDKE